MSDKNIVRRAIAPRPSTIREDDRSVEFVASTEQPVRVFDKARYDYIDEVLVQAGMKMPRNRQVPVIDSHDNSTVENVLGSMREFRQENGETVGRLYFSRKQRAWEAYQDVRDGHLTDVSVGYAVLDGTWIPEGQRAIIAGREYRGPLQVTTSWELREVSLCAIGADPGAKARAAEPAPTVEASAKPAETKQEETVDTKETKPVEPTPTTPPAETVDTTEVVKRAQAEAALRERDRIIGITRATNFPGCDALRKELIETGASVDAANARVIAWLAETSKPVASPAVQHVADDGDKFRAAASDALLMRTMRNAITKPAAGAEQMARVSFEGLARECARRSGIKGVEWMGKDQLYRAVLNKRSSSSIPNHSTSDFDYICADAANKAMMVGWNYAPTTYQLWCNIGSNPDFKAARRVQLSDAPNLISTPEGAEVQYGTMSDTGESVTLATYARKLAITRQALINDDVGAFDSIFRAFGARAANLVNSLPYAVLIANANLADGGALFNTTAVTVGGTGHLNAVGTGAAISNTTLPVGVGYMFAQAAPNGVKLNLSPRFLLTGAAYKTQAEIVVGSVALPDATYSSAVKNPYNTLVAVADANITGNKWFLACDPMQNPTVEVAFLDGQQQPTITQEETSEILGICFTAFIDATAKALDFRGLFYNPGA